MHRLSLLPLLAFLLMLHCLLHPSVDGANSNSRTIYTRESLSRKKAESIQHKYAHSQFTNGEFMAYLKVIIVEIERWCFLYIDISGIQNTGLGR